MPPGVVTSIVVAEDASNPLFCVGIENDSKSPGKALYPIDFVKIESTPSLVRVTIIASDWAIKSTGVRDKSMTIVAAPIISD